MRVLITGGAGFIGSHLSERLLRDGLQVSILDDLNDFYPPALKLQNLEAIRQIGSVRFQHGDIRDPAAVEKFMDLAAPDIVVHLAARAGVRPSLEEPLLYEQTNVLGTLTLLEACRRRGIRKFVFASSSSIYGVANRVPFSEDDQTNLPVSVYAATKIAGEKLCYTYSHLYGLSVVCLRFFTVYGPRQRPDLAIRKFTESIAADRPIPVFGDGGTGRDYTYIDDIVQGLRAALDYPCRFDVFNLGNSHPVLLRDMIATIEKALGKRATLQRLPEQPGDVPITFADISRARKLLGYEPRTPFADGIAKFVAWRMGRPEGQKALTA
jgi:UDP-glucuronate 4-epimerase